MYGKFKEFVLNRAISYKVGAIIALPVLALVLLGSWVAVLESQVESASYSMLRAGRKKSSTRPSSTCKRTR